MHVLALGEAFARLISSREAITLDQQHTVKMVDQHASGHQARDAGTNYHGPAACDWRFVQLRHVSAYSFFTNATSSASVGGELGAKREARLRDLARPRDRNRAGSTRYRQPWSQAAMFEKD